MHYIWVRDGKKEKGKKKTKLISASWFSFTQYTSTLCRCIQNLKTLALIGAKKSVAKKIIIGGKEKWTNKGNDKHEDADYLLHNTTIHTKCLYKILKSNVK